MDSAFWVVLISYPPHNLNVHLHAAATEGVFVETESGDLEWHTLPEPSSGDVTDIAWETCLRVTRALQRRGVSLVGEAGDIDELAEREPLLAAACRNYKGPLTYS